MPFRSFNFHPHILSSLNTLGYKTPTPIQQETIPIILKGKDVLGVAQTGTGKTAAFVLPMLQKLLEGSRAQVRALILVPTRELAQQIHDTIGDLGKHLGLRSTSIYGGLSIQAQKQKLRRGTEIVVACPGRLLDHLGQGSIHLSAVELVVLDEADQMFDMGFLPKVRQILRALPKQRQSLLFSATMPKELRKLAEEMLHKPISVQLNNTVPVKSVTQVVFPVALHLKSELLIKILQTQTVKSALVFTRMKSTAGQLVKELKHAGYRAAALQGDLSQRQRQLALNNFRSGDIDILVATDVASRGIDVADISHVINFDMPETLEAYTHRIGRTGRASKLGLAYSFVTHRDLPILRVLENALGFKLKQEKLPGFEEKLAASPGKKLAGFKSAAPAKNRSRSAGTPGVKSNRADGIEKPKFKPKSKFRNAKSEPDRKTGKPPRKIRSPSQKADQEQRDHRPVKKNSRPQNSSAKSGRSATKARKNYRA